MKNEILNIGKALSRTEQKHVNGGIGGYTCAPQYSQSNCNEYCHSMMIIWSNPQNPGDRDTAENVLENDCGVQFIGDPNIL